MAQEPEELAWPSNYFNYFTEVEEHFQKARGTSLFLMSPLDWALVETWKNAGVPLQAVLRGIDAAFEKWRAGKSRIQMVNSVAYCAQAVLAEAQLLAGLTGPTRPRKQAAAPFSLEELENYLRANVAEIRKQPGFEEVAASVDRLAADVESMYHDLEDLERRLTSLEDTNPFILSTVNGPNPTRILNVKQNSAITAYCAGQGGPSDCPFENTSEFSNVSFAA